MFRADPLSRRLLLKCATVVLTLAPLAARVASAAALISPDAAEAKAVNYTEDASSAKAAQAGNTCANCALYQGSYGSTQGPCQIFPGKEVKAKGWCSSWAPQI
jgi:hypothetical protein